MHRGEVPAEQPSSKPGALSHRLETVLQRSVDLASLPIIRSHVIDGNPVLPMALILEWLAEAALQRYPGMVLRGVDDLRLFKGVVLHNRETATVSLRVGKAERRFGALIVPVAMHGTLVGGQDVTHARGEVVLAERHEPGTRCLSDYELPPMDADREAIYHQILFHGPELQAIQEVEGCDDRTIAARVATSPPPSSWMESPLRQRWLTDPLAIDAAFQLMVLWCQEQSRANSLPTGIGSYRQFRREFPAADVRVVARVKDSTEMKAIADIEFLEADDVLIARIESYECVIDASLNQAFRRNRLNPQHVASS